MSLRIARPTLARQTLLNLTSRTPRSSLPCITSSALRTQKYQAQARPLHQQQQRTFITTSIRAHEMSQGSHPHLKIAELFDVSGLTVAVTGAGTGIGLMITLAMIENGAKVFAIGRHRENLDEIVKRYGGDGKERGLIVPVVGDVTDKESLGKVVKEIEGQAEGGIQILFNNAGVAGEGSREGWEDVDSKDPNAISKKMLESSYQEWEDILRTNTTAAYFTAAAFLPLLSKGKNSVKGYASQIVNTTSISGVMKRASGGQFAYAASKAATFQMTKVLATELMETGIRCNQIAPGVFPSGMTAGSVEKDQKSDLSGTGKGESNPAGRPGSEKDMAGCALFLASRAAIYMNGQAIIPDGGATLSGNSSL
ncbi:short chain dehydrogenase/reductase [Filobasidium floriforme]|uniref:short chain dehydrogenase/reductase n=1 Tax=Filobasidium floriforme TaxID=5210 RepID=UPI001E8EABEC|nr:short chain dehydrogenase/reductase [Filobasidium floriforme]KAH8088127.1 short chain dehydrogenase/reductase [Filobasidium floriforme]